MGLCTPRLALTAAALLLLVGAARAEDAPRDLCANRPGRGSPPCVLDVGRVQLEASFVDFIHDAQDTSVTDTALYGDLTARFGLTPTGEIQLAFSPYVRSRQSDARGVSTLAGHSDLTLAWRQSLKNPDGSGLSVAVQPFLVAPVGKRGIGAGAWQGGVATPVSIPLFGGFALALTPQLAVVHNSSRPGGHLDATGVFGISHALGLFGLGAEFYVDHDADPSGHVTQKTFDISGSWTPKDAKDTQLDLGLNAGLDRHAPDFEVYLGIAHRF